MDEKYPKTVPADPLLAAMKDSKEKTALNDTATQGRPSFRSLANICGAWPLCVRPYKARDDTKRSAHPADQALVSNAALTIDGRTLIPAFLMAITNGDFAAVDSRFRDGSDGDTSRPMMNAERT
ncbi:hypothetical protein Tdes44962_MAKER00488 [Teratosphaeria destructans]|uniref:Uncharacterized protein n=1 Tax=Teratosphaeria destructans TaxID=418781 RepID=A0A9W7W1Q1_9PEZI|nr:hypothetical protein Tdes44962_MAKER00488 [Teratosphaeria destructans]